MIERPDRDCQSVLRFTTGGAIRTVTRYIQCQKHGDHQKHFAAWGGAQRWRQSEWVDGDPTVIDIADVPRRARIW